MIAAYLDFINPWLLIFGAINPIPDLPVHIFYDSENRS